MAAIESIPSSALPVSASLNIAVDAEHTGIRTAGCGVFVATLGVSYLIFNLFIPEAFLAVLVGSLLTAAGISYFVDMRLKEMWPSGRSLYADNNTIHIKRKDNIETSIDPQKQVNVLSWRFEVKRTGRVKKGWYVVGLALEQDDTYIPVYTFASPDQFETLPIKHTFETLQPAEKVKAAAGRDMRLAGQQRRLHTAEKIREINGAEMSLQQFEQYIMFLQKQYPSWMLTK